jgi:hypothetical protein
MKVNSICIVGGGSSGWMLARALTIHTPEVRVQLVSSPKIGTIGVGESTIPYMVDFIRDTLKFEEKDWMEKCAATYKSSIRFNNFTNSACPAYHPFFTQDFANGYEWAVKSALDPANTKLQDYNDMHLEIKSSESNKFSKDWEGKNLGYAYHLDAERFGNFCKENSPEVRHIIGTIKDTSLNNEGGIQSVTTEEGDTITADLFVDCSGFRAVLLGGVLKEPFNPLDSYLINNKAMASRMYYAEDKEKDLQPYTDCTALQNGWAWNTPLWDKIGTGYVYSDKFCSKESAEVEFREYLKDRFGEARANLADIFHINIRTGHYRNSWVKNCASLTLTSGFIEPLESTGLAITAGQIDMLIEVIKKGYSTELDRTRFNYKVSKNFEETKDFIATHYLNTGRGDSEYWRYVSDSIQPPSSLLATLEGLDTHTEGLHYFNTKSWEHILIGFKVPGRFTSKKSLKYGDSYLINLSDKDIEKTLESSTQYITNVTNYVRDIVDNMPSHYQYLKDTIYYEKK